MFKPATTALLITAAFTSAFAASSSAPGPATATVEAREPFLKQASGFEPLNLTPIKTSREDIEARGRHRHGRTGGRPAAAVAAPPAPAGADAGAAGAVSARSLLSREEDYLQGRGGVGKALASVAGQAAKGAGGALASWAAGKLRREDFEVRAALEELLEARGKLGKAATSVGGQAANGAAGALTTWALNKIREDIDAREAIEELLDIEARAGGGRKGGKGSKGGKGGKGSRGGAAASAADPGAAPSPAAAGAVAARSMLEELLEARDDLVARAKIGKALTNVGGQAANGAAGALTSWALNKLREEVDARDAIEELLEAREELEARGKFGKAATHIGGDVANGVASSATTWALGKIHREVDARDAIQELLEAREELEARGKLGKAATSVGGQVANGVASSATTWALNKIHREDLEEARDAIEELLERDDQEGLDAREFLENYLEARDYELEDLE